MYEYIHSVCIPYINKSTTGSKYNTNTAAGDWIKTAMSQVKALDTNNIYSLKVLCTIKL